MRAQSDPWSHLIVARAASLAGWMTVRSVSVAAQGLEASRDVGMSKEGACKGGLSIQAWKRGVKPSLLVMGLSVVARGVVCGAVCVAECVVVLHSA